MYSNDMYQFYNSIMDYVHQYVFAMVIPVELEQKFAWKFYEFIIAKTNGTANSCKVLYLYKH